MPTNVYAKYQEQEVLNADPLKLVALLYQGAMEAVGAARRHLAQGAIPERTRQINRAWELVQELSRSLDHERGGELSRRLAELYAYIQQRLIDANAQQSDAALAEAETLLATLAAAWREIQPPPIPVPAQVHEPLACNA